MNSYRRAIHLLRVVIAIIVFSSPVIVASAVSGDNLSPKTAFANLLLASNIQAVAPAAVFNYSCDDAGLNEALLAGGNATFGCPLGGDTIYISGSKTVAINLNIDGQNRLTISGGDTRTVFTVNSGVTLGLSRVTISQGHPPGFSAGGGVVNNGNLNVADSTFDGNSAMSGGAIWSAGALTVTNSIFLQ